jgi:amino acid adenylation domain-containing protein
MPPHGKEWGIVIDEWNRTSAPYPRDATVHGLFEEVAAAWPDAPALECGGERMTYAELDARANRLARRLRGLGAGAETRVAVCLERGPELIVALLAALKAGAAYVPLDPAHPVERRRYMLRDSGAAVVVTDSARGDWLDGGAPPAVLLDDPAVRGALEAEDGGALRLRGHALETAYVIYTSGSTGLPKGVAVPHRGVVRLVRNSGHHSMGAGDRVAQLSNTSFDAATLEIWGALLNGGCLVLVPRETALDPAGLARTLADRRIDVLVLATALFHQVAQTAPAAFAGVREVIVGGEAFSPRHAAAVLRAGGPARLVNGYGPTESTTMATGYRVREVPPDAASLPIGTPVANTTAYVLDGALRALLPGDGGELYLGGDGLARGYLGQPGRTAERFVPHPFASTPGERLYRTGDRARWTGHGELEFLGRVDHQVKVRGFRIEPGEIEAALAEHPGVGDCAVLAREDGGERRLVAWMTGRGGPAPDAAALRAHLRARVPEHMVPAFFVAMDRLPLTPNGKVDHAALPAPRPEASADYVAPRAGLEAEVAAVWREALGADRVGARDNFFEIGGSSLLLARVQALLGERLGRTVPVVDLLRCPTVASLAARLESGPAKASDNGRERASIDGNDPAPGRPDEARADGNRTGREIAIVGMAGRFPGADGIEAFWCNQRAGTESITRFGRDEMARAGADAALLDDPRWVAARGVLEDADQFDAAFFGFAPREAEIMDPQHRIFLECCWEALEHAGVDAARCAEPVGVFGGAGPPTYLVRMLVDDPAALDSVGPVAARTSNASDYLTTRVSYRLGLEGPSLDVQTGCSTSLVAVHLACQSLLAEECGVALAGGVSIVFPQRGGHLHQPGGVYSPDGRCRPFDARAAGTVFGGGAGVVALKRLDHALRDGDTVHAVILGSAINNDGAAKVGFAAPSVAGQAKVVRAAHRRAGVHPSTIGYVEAHGTGTELGDPVEVAALTEAFRAGTDERGFCALGSGKGHVGHLDAAAGIAGLIRTVMALRARELPPTLHYQAPNPALELSASPFFVSDEPRPWEPRLGVRRAGVSSFGVGGTNAHVVLQEAPDAPAPAPAPGGEWQALVLSARSPEALDQAAERLSAHLRAHPEQALADVAWTLAAGRREMDHRRVAVCRTHIDGAALLDAPAAAAGPADGAPPVAFLFPGQGSQYAGMGRGLYDAEPVYRAEVDRCAAILQPHLGLDLRTLLHPAPGEEAEAGARLAETWLTQPALFVVGYAVARLWASRGVQPAALLGHSLGEYVAATLAGVFSLEDALALVARRGRLVQDLPRGAMLSVPLPEDEVHPLLPPGVSVAAVNAAGSCVVSGPDDAVAKVEAALRARGEEPRRLHASHAFHSAMMEPALDAFRQAAAAVPRHAPRIPFVSNVTGTWITAEQATDPEYWVRHLREPVRFADGAATLLADPRCAFVECGPGATLATLVRRHPDARGGRAVATTLRRPADAGDGHADAAVFLRAAGTLWCAGVPVDWGAWHQGERRRRIPLPAYPFQRRRYWTGPDDGAPARLPAPAERASRPAAARHPRPPLATPFVAPRGETETAVARVWEEMLGVAPVGADDDFHALGGDSLLAAQLISRVRECLGVELPVRSLYEAPTVAGLARAALALRAAGDPAGAWTGGASGRAPALADAEGLAKPLAAGVLAGV